MDWKGVKLNLLTLSATCTSPNSVPKIKMRPILNIIPRAIKVIAWRQIVSKRFMTDSEQTNKNLAGKIHNYEQIMIDTPKL